MKKTRFLSTSALGAGIRLTEMERRAGRLMRAPDHPGESTPSVENNDAGNNGGNPGNGGNDGNNSDDGFNPDAFWNPPSTDDDGSPARGSAGSESAGDGTGDSGNFATTFRESVGRAAFSPVFSDAIAQDMANGDYTSANAAFQEVGRQAMTQALAFSIQVMQQQETVLTQRFEQMLNERFNNRDNRQTLETEFPELYSNRAIAPMVETVFNQALKLNGNDRKKAAAMAKQMLRSVAGTLSNTGFTDDMNRNRRVDMPDAAQSLLDDLLGQRG